MLPSFRSLYNAVPSSSRPTSAARTPGQPSGVVSAEKHLKPHNVEEATIRLQTAWWEMMGFSVATVALLVFALTLFIVWGVYFVTPFSTFIKAKCLVLNATQTSLAVGFMREPLYRAEVYVYVFNTSYTQCCCPNVFGQERCAEWEAVAFDNILQSYTSGDKTDFLQVYGYPGTFHNCWHSSQKEQVVLTRQFYWTFLMAPILALILGLWGFRTSSMRVQTYRDSVLFYDQLTGKISDDTQLEDAHLKKFTRKPVEEEEEDEEEEGI